MVFNILGSKEGRDEEMAINDTCCQVCLARHPQGHEIKHLQQREPRTTGRAGTPTREDETMKATYEVLLDGECYVWHHDYESARHDADVLTDSVAHDRTVEVVRVLWPHTDGATTNETRCRTRIAR